MLPINEQNRIDARDIYAFVEVKTPFDQWVKRCIDYADLQEDKDFSTKLLVNNKRGRPSTLYQFTIQAAKEMCIVSATPKAKELRRWLIDIATKRENLDLITVEQAVFAAQVIHCLKYIDNQREAYSNHQKQYVEENITITNQNYIYAQFNQFRSKINGWDKASVDKAIDQFLKQHNGFSKGQFDKENMSTKLSFLDVGEAIRVAVIDILYSEKADTEVAHRFSRLCAKMAKEMEVEPERSNENTLFRNKEKIVSVKQITEKASGDLNKKIPEKSITNNLS